MLSSLKTPPVANPPAVPDPESRHKARQQDLLQFLLRNFSGTFQAQES